MSAGVVYDVAVVGGGPAGAVLGWALATRNVRVVVLEREQFPREKVCGDYVEPRGLRLLREMGCLDEIEAASPLPITDVVMYLESACEYRGRIPFYDAAPGLLPHGYVVPRHELDARLLNAARRAGAAVFERSAITSLERSAGAFTLTGRRDSAPLTVRARLVAGADGVHSIVARTAGLLRDDPRHVAVSQRAYAGGISVDKGEAAFFFDRDLFPGYGWMFPMSGGRANVGVGILSETRTRLDIKVPELLQAFLEKLRRHHPGCRHAHLISRPLGGIVRTYGGAGPNYFDGGVLVGDAGCFVDPMTGEGITPAMESAVIAAEVLADAVAAGRSDAAQLSPFETRFRRYFDPALGYVDLCAAVMRNWCLRDFWLRSVAQGCRRAREDGEFARVAFSAFGGRDVQPLSILSQVWTNMVVEAGTDGAGFFFDALTGRSPSRLPWLDHLWTFADGWWRSVLDDPSWHAAWTADVLEKWARVAATLHATGDPRREGPLLRRA